MPLMTHIERLADRPDVLKVVQKGRRKAFLDGMMQTETDLSDFQVVFDNKRRGVVVFSMFDPDTSMSGKREGYIWWWWHSPRAKKDQMMSWLVWRAMGIMQDQGAEVVKCGINPKNTPSINLAARCRMEPETVYFTKDL